MLHETMWHQVLRSKPIARSPKRSLFLQSTIFVALLSACGSSDNVTVNDNGVSSGGVEIETIEPALGPLDGGQTIMIRGSGFTQSGTQVVIGERTADAVVVNNAGELTVRTPAGIDPAAVDVLVFTSAGFASRINGYDYNPRPTVTAVASPSGPATGGNQVTVTGTGFQALAAGTSVFMFGPYQAREANVTSDTSATVMVPSSATSFEIVDVSVTNSNGTSVDVAPYRYQSAGMLATRSQFRNRDVGELYFIATNGDAAKIADTREADGKPLFITAMTIDPSTGTIYGFDRRSLSLVTLDPFTGVGTIIGEVAADVRVVQGLSFRGGVLYGFRRSDANGNKLIAIDKSTGAEIDFATNNLSCCGGALVTSDDGQTTYFSIGASIDTVDVATGIAAGTPVAFSGSTIRGIANVDGEVFALQRSDIVRFGGGGGNPEDLLSTISKVDLATGSKTVLGLVPRMCSLVELPMNGAIE